MAEPPVLNAFTVDVEDYYQVSAFENDIDRRDWPSFQSRLEGNVDYLLDALDIRGVKATFFVLGWVADHHPRIVRKIAAREHEIGCHSYWHRLIYRQTQSEFRDDVRRAKQVIEDVIGGPVEAYRAPSFSITKESLWALDVLVEEGFRIDSSIFPARHDRYGIPDAKRHIHRVNTTAGRLCEFPPTTVRLLGCSVPVAGGGYFRIQPWWSTRHFFNHVNRAERHPFVFYVHPWEIDAAQPRLKVGSRLSRFRHYVNLAGTRRKLDALLKTFRFDTVSNVLAAHLECGDLD